MLNPLKYIDVTLTCDTSAMADGDVICDTAEIPNAVLVPGEGAELLSISVLDEDDQGQPLDIVLLRTNVSLGTKNSAPNITDANARAAVLSVISVASGDFYDFGGSKFADISSIGLMISTRGSASAYVSAIARGAATYSENGLKLRFGIRQR